MVPPEEIDKEQPTTLPADFGEWDSGEDSAEQSTTSSRVESFSGSGGAPRPAARVAVLPVAGRSTNGSARTQAAAYAEVEQVYPPVQSPAGGSKYEEAEGPGKHSNKMVVFGSIGAIAVLLVGGTLGYMKMRQKPVAPNQVSGSQTSMTMTDTQKPTAATTTETANATPEPVNAPAATAAEPTVPLRAQSEAMNKQLNAPSRISSDLKALTGREAPPAADFNAGMGIGASASSAFSGQSGPKVKIEAAKKVNISSGVAAGLLVQRTTPVYPPLAKTAHVTGTVVIQATISKNGGVGALRVISGPAMLRKSALDSVKSWRFRPYLLDGEPVEADTQVSVTFALAQ